MRVQQLHWRTSMKTVQPIKNGNHASAHACVHTSGNAPEQYSGFEQHIGLSFGEMTTSCCSHDRAAFTCKWRKRVSVAISACVTAGAAGGCDNATPNRETEGCDAAATSTAAHCIKPDATASIADATRMFSPRGPRWFVSGMMQPGHSWL